MRRQSLIAAFVVWAAATAAFAAPPDNVSPLKSRFTTFDPDACQVVHRHKDGDTRLCDGLPGYKIHMAEGDLRTYVSFGPKAELFKAAKQTLAPFNSLVIGKTGRVTVEWRYSRQGGRDEPYAAILRYATHRDGEKGQVLVVTRISDKDACHVAYIDALANPSAIALARSVADELARSFDCATDPRVIGAKGRSPM